MDTLKHVVDLLPDFLAGSFDEAERTAIQSHLQSCPTCRHEYESLSTLWNTLGVLPNERPGPQLRERFNAMLAAYEQGIRHAAAHTSFLAKLDAFIGRLWPHRPSLQFGIAFLMLLAGGSVGFLANRAAQHTVLPDTSVQVAQLHGELMAIRGMLAISLMQQQSATDRLKGINIGSRIAESDPQVTKSLLNTLRYDPSVNVRLAAIDALSNVLGESEVRKVLVEDLPRQSSPLVQLAMVELVVDVHDARSLGVLTKMESDPKVNEVVRKKIQQGIQLLR